VSTEGDEKERQRRRRRVQRLKKIILGTVFALIVIPTVTCIVLGIYIHGLRGELSRLQEQLAILHGQLAESMALPVNPLDSPEEVPEVLPAGSDSAVMESTETVLPDTQEDMEPEAEPEALPEEKTRRVYLTFDDGPSVETDVILDILKEYDVKATFFVVGKTDEASQAAYRRIVEEGHTLGMHSYSHVYSEIYASREAFVADLEKLQSYLYEVTGQESYLYRFPGGSSNQVSKTPITELVECLNERGITFFDWNVSSKDAAGGTHSQEEIIYNTINGLSGHDTCVVLFHDSPTKKSTVEALPSIIEQIQAMEDTELLPITEDTEPVQHQIAKTE